MSNVVILNQADTAKLVERVCTSSKSLVADIHQAGVSTLDHIREHGNYTSAIDMLNGLSNGLRVKGLVAWYKKFSNGKFQPKQDGKTKVWSAELLKDRVDGDFDIEGAANMTFADLTTEVNPETLSLEKFIKGLKRTATNGGTFANSTIPKVSSEARVMALRVVQFIETLKEEKAA